MVIDLVRTVRFEDDCRIPTRVRDSSGFPKRCRNSKPNSACGVNLVSVYIVRMRRSLTTLVGSLVALCVCTSLTAVVPDSVANHYEGIPGRNAFGLKPPPKPEANTPPPQIAKIVLTGITTILGNKRALMKVHPVGAKPSDQAKENSLILTEGQREGDIEVIEINEDAGSVKVNNAGTIMTLTFEKDGAKLPATPAPPVAASGLPPVPGGIPMPQANPGNLNPAMTNAAGIRPLPTRKFRVPT